ncbi:MAG: hypothetical protein N2Z60_02275 [Elusimicrobiales bacterium]|nr:hypothetical protein [Elusimicrobiales bacterium]HOL62529.1 hypothetical protein [Elusimicrobiales bacterium]HPO94543.1 hypothetical protein [Elusimicrobiales bacterium]
MKFKILVSVIILATNLYSQSMEEIKSSSEKISLVKEESLNITIPGFIKDAKYNQQNMALSKIKINEAQPDMDNTVILKLQKGDIDFYLKDLTKDGFEVKAYTDGIGFYFIMVDLTGRNVASDAVGLAKYYYVREVLVSQKTYNELFGSSLKRSKISYAARIGTITGGINYSPVDLTINKIAWTIKGGINSSPIDLTINHDEKTIKGGANLSPVELKFDWSVEEVRIYGGANRSPVDYTVNWKKGILEGYSNHSPVKIEFDMKESVAGDNIVEIKGYANHAPVELKFDKVSGKLTGGMNHSPVDLKLTNCDLYDFLQYIFVFLK